ncbi:4-hydroxy-tetrahydrodipicolinate reductase [uncultured Prevotella sp.]|uniref:4-hydroxy-tetrahydrodipicolinate reductase n=1 Tax=uncultured Prevotella sp. TaxID=159272 RepID=UPI00258F5FF2|nr:4-hydroxy-tetrahydrodipicolinate reductase [uncultured Prevotella sp.]
MKIALIGYGKMGKMIEEIARSRGHEIVSIIDIDNQQDFESEAFEVRQACENGKTLFWASNFSIGVAIFSAVNRYLAKIMNQFPQYDVEMEETHHVHKLDHPSGTAITLAEEIVENIDRKEAWAEDTTDPKLLRVDHIRRGEVPGIHTIRYDSDADIITITHDAHSRRGFALGAVLAAEYTKDHNGLLTISDMFKF